MIPCSSRTRPFQLVIGFTVCSRSSSATHSGTTLTTNGIDFIDKDNCWSIFLRVSNKSRTRLAPTPTNIFTNSEPGNREERYVCFTGNGFGKKGFPVPEGSRSTLAGIRAPSASKFTCGSLRIPLLHKPFVFFFSTGSHQRTVLLRFVFLIGCTALPKFIGLLRPPLATLTHKHAIKQEP